MNDAFQAFLEFLIDLFNALSKFLGFDFDLGEIIKPSEETKKDESAGE